MISSPYSVLRNITVCCHYTLHFHLRFLIQWYCRCTCRVPLPNLSSEKLCKQTPNQSPICHIIFFSSIWAVRNPKSLNLIGYLRALQRSGFSHPEPAYGPRLIFHLSRLFPVRTSRPANNIYLVWKEHGMCHLLRFPYRFASNLEWSSSKQVFSACCSSFDIITRIEF